MSSNLAQSLDCSRGGRGVEVRPAGVGGFEVAGRSRCQRRAPSAPSPWPRGSGAARGVPSSGRRRPAPDQGALGLGPGKTPVGFPACASPERSAGCLEVDVRSGRLGSPWAPDAGAGPLQSAGRASAPQHRPRPGREEGPPRRGSPWREDEGGGPSPARGESAAPPALRLAGPPPRRRGARRRLSIGPARRPIPEGPGEEEGAVRGGLGSGAGGSAGPSRTEPPRHRPRSAAASGRLLRRPGERAPSISRCGHSSGPGAGKTSTRNPQTRAQILPASRATMTHFNKGPSYGLSAEVKNKVRWARVERPPPRARRGRLAAARGSLGLGRRWAALRLCAFALAVWLCGDETSGRRESGRASPSWPRSRSAGPPALSPGFVPRRGPGPAAGGGFPGSWNPAAPACSHGSRSVAAGRAPPGRGRSCLVIRP